jgi:large subunit ribosomal protein L30
VSAKRIRVRQVRSAIGRTKDQHATLRGLGIRRLHQSVELENTPSVRGMIKKISHLLEWEDVK